MAITYIITALAVIISHFYKRKSPFFIPKQEDPMGLLQKANRRGRRPQRPPLHKGAGQVTI
jgi:hypothetical protein